MRVLAGFEFDGTEYSGWQRQPGVLTVQESIETALSSLFRRSIRITGAGRTDAGVHAMNMPAHFDILPGEMNGLPKGLNHFLPSGIACLFAVPVADDFHARYSAVSRSYSYSIGRGSHPLRARYQYQKAITDLDTPAMQLGARLSTGRNSWRGFAKEGSGNRSWEMHVTDACVEEKSTGWTLNVTADRFLRGAVRIWAGTLLRIGTGGISPETVGKILEAGDRSLSGPSLPACGLTLTAVEYPPPFSGHCRGGN